MARGLRAHTKLTLLLSDKTLIQINVQVDGRDDGVYAASYNVHGPSGVTLVDTYYEDSKQAQVYETIKYTADLQAAHYSVDPSIIVDAESVTAGKVLVEVDGVGAVEGTLAATALGYGQNNLKTTTAIAVS